ncbi:MAG: class I SAM-dependent methyltransferase [Shewanella sp.]
MSAEKIATAYNQITHRWNSDEFDLSNGILQHQKAISFVKNRGKALDVGCGCTGRFIDLLLDEAFMPAGIDISPAMLKIARAKHPDIHFILGDIGQYELSDKYDFITAWDSIWHSPLAEQKSLITKIVASLNIGGVFIF